MGISGNCLASILKSDFLPSIVKERVCVAYPAEENVCIKSLIASIDSERMKENPRLYPVFVRISASPSVLSRKYVASITILNCASAKKTGSSHVTREV
jgi:hypothetical protein